MFRATLNFRSRAAKSSNMCSPNRGVHAEEVQALSQLDKLDTARKLLLKISNAATRDLKSLEGERDRSATHLMSALGIAEVKAATLLAAVNVKRAALDLPALTKLEATTSIRDGLETQGGATAPKVPKVQAKTDVARPSVCRLLWVMVRSR